MTAVMKLVNGDIVIGEVTALEDGQKVFVKNPYTVQNQRLMPYMLMDLAEPMADITLRAYDIMWSKNIDDFSEVKTNYVAATTGIQTKSRPKLEI